jgi:hypothetical protein
MFTAVAAITLAVSIGANSAIFSVTNGVLLKPLPYPRPEELIDLHLTAPGVNFRMPSRRRSFISPTATRDDLSKASDCTGGIRRASRD